MSSGGGRFDLRFAFPRGTCAVCVAATGGLGDGMPRRLPFLDGVSSALSGGCPSLNVADRELERGGTPPVPSGVCLIVDEKGTYIADGGRPESVGVEVRSDPDGDEPYESSEGGDAGVTVAEIHALWRILADLFAVIGVFRDTAESMGFGVGWCWYCGWYCCFSLSYVEERYAALFMAAERSVELRREELFVVLETMRSPKSDETRICGVVAGKGGLDHVVRMVGDGRALWRASRRWNQGYVRVLALQIWESSFMWRIDETMSRQKYASTIGRSGTSTRKDRRKVTHRWQC